MPAFFFVFFRVLTFLITQATEFLKTIAICIVIYAYL